MQKVVLIILFIIYGLNATSQESDKYYHYLDSGYVAIKEGKNKAAFDFYIKAFSEKTPEHPYRLYEASVLAVRSGYIDLSFLFLNMSIDKGFSNLEHVKKNPIFSTLNDPRFERCLKKIAHKDSILTQLSSTLDSIFRIDQKYRIMLEKVLDESEKNELVKKIIEIDSLNLIIVEKIIEKYGFLGNSLKTPDARNTMWLVIQHSSQEIRDKYFNILRIAVERGELLAHNMALIEDRTNLEKTGKQKYGTQYRINDGCVVIFDLEDPENVNSVRKKIGLPPIEDYIRSIKQMKNLP